MVDRNFTIQISRRPLRHGMTLLELLLALAMTAVVSGLIGMLVQTYLLNENLGKDRVEQAKLARLTLNMIADDIRAVIRPQTFDATGLTQILGGSGASSGSASASSDATTSGTTSQLGASSGAGSGASASLDSGMDEMSLGSLPPGLYGTENTIEFDISRLPRPDQYFPEVTDPNSGAIADMPSDVKTVSYFVQAVGTDGVTDPLGDREAFHPNAELSVTQGATGLVRRAVDRVVTQYAYMNASTDSLLRTGELIAPEVVAIEFQYYDGTMWQVQWDSSQLGLPAAIKVTIAVQRESMFQLTPYDAGGGLLNITPETLREYGIDLYSMNVIIPGVMLLPKPTASDSSTSALGF